MAFLMSRLLLERVENGNFRKCYKTAESAAGQTGSNNGGWWVLDCDFPLPKPEDNEAWWGDYAKLEAASNERRADFRENHIVPTPNGFHILVRPFGPLTHTNNGLRWNGGEIKCGELKKNAPTVLFAETS